MDIYTITEANRKLKQIKHEDIDQPVILVVFHQ